VAIFTKDGVDPNDVREESWMKAIINVTVIMNVVGWPLARLPFFALAT
jgi:hypothetical protein